MYTWLVISLAVLAAGLMFAMGWWLGRRRQAAHIASLRELLRDSYATAYRERRSLHQRYEGLVQNLMQAATSSMRASRRRP